MSDSATLQTIAHQALLFTEFSRQYWSRGTISSFSGESSRPRDQTHASYVPCNGRQAVYHLGTWEAIGNYSIHLHRILEFESIFPDLMPKDLSKTWTHADSLPNCKEIIFIFLYLTLCEMIVRLLSSLQIKCNVKK